MQLQAMILSVQKTVVEGTVYAKIFAAFPPTDENEAVSSVVQLNIKEGAVDDILRAARQNDFKLGELVNIEVDNVRGGKNTLKQIVTAISSAQRPAVQPGPQSHQQPQPEKK